MARLVRTNTYGEDRGVWCISVGNRHYTFIYEPDSDPERIGVSATDHRSTDQGVILTIPVLEARDSIDVPDPINNTTLVRTIETYCWFKLKIPIEA